MRVAVLLALTSTLLTVAPGALAEIVRFREVDGSSVSGTLERPKGPRRAPLLLVLRDRTCGREREPGLKPRIDAPEGTARLELAPPQPGARGGAACGSAAHQARVLEVVTAVTRLREDARWWNRRLYIAGSSGGATVAASAAKLLPETKGVVLIDPPAAATDGRTGAAPILLLQAASAPGTVPARATRRRKLNSEAEAAPEIAAFIAAQEARFAPRPVRADTTAAAPKAKRAPVRTAAVSTKEPLEAAPAHKRPKAGAPPPPAKAAKVRPALAGPSRQAVAPPPRLRARLPAEPDLPPARRRADLRTSKGTPPPSSGPRP